ncbi:hypothetical protein, partial [Escherichia coli]|uniref:hypothetical protein n=1 Tax=Escherichia coli TaxID=562 RepID=UPI003F5355D0
ENPPALPSGNTKVAVVVPWNISRIRVLKSSTVTPLSSLYDVRNSPSLPDVLHAARSKRHPAIDKGSASHLSMHLSINGF